MNPISNFFIAHESNNYRPGALSYKALFIYALLLLLLRLLLASLPAQSAAVESQTLMDLINAERSNRNLTTLTTHQSLVFAASQKSQDMIERDYFAHIDPDGNYIWGRITAAGYGAYKILGENLAVDFLTSEGMVKAWIDSPTHRDNLLHRDFLEQGLVALYGDFNDRYTNLTTSLFGTRVAGTFTPPPPPSQQLSQPSLPPAGGSAPTPAPPPPVALVPAQQPVSNPTTTQPTITPVTSTQRPIEHRPCCAQTGTDGLLSKLNLQSAVATSRIIFTLIGIMLLGIFSIDSVIISKHEAAVVRSHSSAHLFGLMILVLISILIWWW